LSEIPARQPAWLRGAIHHQQSEKQLLDNAKGPTQNAWTCPPELDKLRLRGQVRQVYERVAADPTSGFHFNTGADYAVDQLHYARNELNQLPEYCTARFAGVGNPFRIGEIESGMVVLDHACGAGMDLLLAARKTGPTGQVIGVDVTPAILACARTAVSQAGLNHRISLRPGLLEALPVDSESIDIVISNGVLNLSPDKVQVMREVMRVLRPGGRLLLADVVVEKGLSMAARTDADLWAACVSGAIPENELLLLAQEMGMVEERIVERYDCFRGTSVERKFGRALKVSSAALFARKPF
jgi:arsenite methyltransferase